MLVRGSHNHLSVKESPTWVDGWSAELCCEPAKCEPAKCEQGISSAHVLLMIDGENVLERQGLGL